MYLPPAFRVDDRESQHGLIRARPLGLLLTPDLSANPVPFLLDDGEGLGVLRCHLSRANPQVRVLAEALESLGVFGGSDAYVSPTWYATKAETHRVVPTWNYATVHAWGRPRLVEDAGWLRRQIDGLTALQEGSRDEPWAVEDAPEEFVEAQIRGIVGVEIAIERIEGKWKASQNRSEADRAGVAAGLREMADWVEGQGNPKTP